MGGYFENVQTKVVILKNLQTMGGYLKIGQKNPKVLYSENINLSWHSNHNFRARFFLPTGEKLRMNVRH